MSGNATVTITYPFNFNSGSFSDITRLDELESAIAVTLLTPIGSREMFPEFGSKLHLVPYHNSDPALMDNLLFQWIQEPLLEFVPEIELIDVITDYQKEDLFVDIKWKDIQNPEIVNTLTITRTDGGFELKRVA